VNVWRAAQPLRFATLLATSSVLAGCIDDFDHPNGYGDGGSASPNGYDCEAFCTDSQACESEGSTSECRSQCIAVERVVRSAGCRGPWDETLDCASSAPRRCGGASEYCATELENFAACLGDYCTDHPSECSF
jgi:hypothetical protein